MFGRILNTVDMSIKENKKSLWRWKVNKIRDGSRTAETSKITRFMIIVNGWKPLIYVKLFYYLYLPDITCLLADWI